MRRIIQSRRINAVAILTTLAALAAHPAVSGLAPEAWAPYLAALVAAAAVLGGAGPGVHGVPQRGSDIHTRETDQHPAVRARPGRPGRGRDIISGSLVLLTLLLATGCEDTDGAAVSAEVSHVWFEGACDIEGGADYTPATGWDEGSALYLYGSIDMGAAVDICLDDGHGGTVCDTVVVALVIDGDSHEVQTIDACYWAAGGAVQGCEPVGLPVGAP